MVARMKRSDVIDNGNIRAGDVIVGLASFGLATYEDAYNSGMGSNGLTSARHDVFHNALAKKYPEAFDPAMPPDLVYSGGKSLTDSIEVEYEKKEADGATTAVKETVHAGKLVLSPTRTYSPVIKSVLQVSVGFCILPCTFYKATRLILVQEVDRSEIHGIVHCSGGAQTKILHFVEDLHVIKDDLFPLPPLFQLIQEQSGTSWKEMYKVFNMGHRMELYCSPQVADKVIAVARRFNVSAKIIGRVEKSDAGKRLTIESPYGTFQY